MGDSISKYYEIASKMNTKKIQEFAEDEINQTRNYIISASFNINLL